ncbi:hypothetical protein FYJ53_06010 [Eubacterium sp. BL-380-WT-2B]|uniref:lipocalin family protein n=1 Tax=Eubacterium sp. BL-380-WT-2B TaxID=2605785 RepID=UPI0012B387AF|nr:lipocalin family protein [Eubacterium sp. BL-380-WT-2B]MSS93318.1 hypothetical protein [Eubacterium sp. BL-380-WT-2B]
MPVKQYTEYEKETNGDWTEQNPKTNASMVAGLELESFSVTKAVSSDTLVYDAFMIKPLGVCVINFDLRAINAKPAQEHNHYFTVPEKYRPSLQVFNAGVGGIYGWIQLRIDPDGKVYGWGREGATTPRGTLIYRV